jgi:hypothetical protein
VVWGGGFNISYKFNISCGFDISVGGVGDKSNIGFAICCCNIKGLGIVVGIVRCIRGAIRFLWIVGFSKTL